MNKGLAVVGSVGLGAALMYIFDPDGYQIELSTWEL